VAITYKPLWDTATAVVAVEFIWLTQIGFIWRQNLMSIWQRAKKATNALAEQYRSSSRERQSGSLSQTQLIGMH
jgi:hypothetical protein